VDDHWHPLDAGLERGAIAPLAGQQPVALISVGRHQQRLQHAVLRDRPRELVQRGALHLAARVELVLDVDVGE
jgi:hypothetical protein